MLLAAAQHLAQHRHFDGTVYVIFQPAEEGGGGAREMLKGQRPDLPSLLLNPANAKRLADELARLRGA